MTCHYRYLDGAIQIDLITPSLIALYQSASTFNFYSKNVNKIYEYQIVFYLCND